ncbi:DUF748 domain-containing protein [Campylobacter gastrosuis]|uniref:DUF748 domain-containing protein n=1 Tax=Campylobacter gastrosuis TaxID=2974576 RepID=A0ABT7HPH2_9BACT|nr:DUF748 domain-containing protein [Campylobacter gastrosuis]MDL0088294.1 DUF748 domain-containing protein [Campylobacter gastrosuis]
MIKKYKRILISLFSILCLILVYTLFGFYGVPYLIKNTLPKKLSDNNLSLAIKNVNFNPYTFELNASNIELNTTSKLFKVRQFDIDMDLMKMVTKNFSVKTINLYEPDFNITRQKDGSLNFLNLATNSEKNDNNKSAKFNFELKNLRLINGKIDFNDLALKKPFSTKINDINYQITDINLEQNSLGKHILSLKSNEINDLNLSLNALINPINLNAIINLNRLTLDKIWQSYLENSTKTRLKGGELSLALNLNFKNNLEINGTINLEKPALNGDFADILVSKIDLNKINLNTDFNQTMLTSTLNLENFNLKNSDFSLLTEKISAQNLNINQTNTNTILKIPEIKIAKSSFNGYETSTTLNDINLNLINLTFNKNLNINLNEANINEIKTKLENSEFLGIKNIKLNEINYADNALKIALISVLNTDIFSKNRAFFSIKELALNTLNLKSNDLGIKSILINEPFLRAKINKNGIEEINNIKIPKSKTAKNDKNTTNFLAKISDLEIKNFKADINENFIKKPLNHKIAMNAKISEFSSDFKEPFLLNLDLKTDEQIQAKTSGKIALNPLNINLKIDADFKDLSNFNKITDEYLNAKISSGEAKYSTILSFKKEPILNGSLKLSNLYFDQNGTKILGTKALNIARLGLNGTTLNIDDIALNEPYLNAKISKDGSLNLSKILKDTNSTDDNQTQKNHDFKVEKLAINDALIDFTDDSLVLPFHISIKNLNTQIDKIDSKNLSHIQANGVVGESGSANIFIKTEPFKPTKLSQISLKFKDIALENSTPYTATFVGKKINGGTLGLNLNYKIDDEKMKGENEIRIEKIVLGDDVKSQKALSLPLSLAVSILEDKNGVINLNLPVSGDMSNPKFSYGGIIFGAIMKIFTDVITSPFSLLGNVLGIADAKGLSSVDFTAGSDEILLSQNKKIADFKKIIDTKPKMLLKITPSYDENADKKAIQKRLLDAKISSLVNKNGLSFDEALAQISKTTFGAKQPKEPYAELIKMQKIANDSLEKLAKNRAINLKNAMNKAGISDKNIKINDKISKTKAQMDIYVPILMGVED